MALSNFERMMQLIEDVFDVRNDPQQLNVDEKVIERLQQMHPSTLSEYNDGKEPAAWILLIPTTQKLMQEFIQGKINEQQLFNLTPVNASYEALYLCSATVLPEYRGKGIAKKLTVDAIRNIQKTNPVKTLFVWPFSKEGDALAEAIAQATTLSLVKKT